MSSARRLGVVLILSVVAVVPVRGQGARTVHQAALAAVADGATQKTKALGWASERGAFDETNSRGGILVGFDLGMHEWFDSEIVTAIRPVCRLGSGEVVGGKGFGSFAEAQRQPRRDGIKRVVQLRARAGYAVGAMSLRTGIGIDAMRLTYLRIDGDRLDPAAAYQSEWVGNQKGGSEKALATDAMPIVGVFGNVERDRVRSLGLIRAQLPARVLEKKAEGKRPEKPIPPQREPEKPAPARWTYRDALRRVQAEIPAGWVKAEEGADPGEVLFRPEKAAADEVSVTWQVARVAPAPLEELGATLTPTAGPYRELKGSLRDAARTLAPGEVVLDRARSRFFWRTKEGRIDTLHVCHAGADDAVTLHCQAHEATFGGHLGAFAQVSDSLAFDAAKVYQPPKEASGGWWLPALVFVAVSAVIFAPLALYLGRRRPAAARAIPQPHAEQKAPPTAKAFAPSAGILTELSEPPPFALPVEEPTHFVCFGARAYRAYVLPEEVYFIDAGAADAKQWQQVGRGAGGLLGALVGSAIDHEMAERKRQRERELDSLSPDDLFALADGVTNFRVRPDDVDQASIDAAGFWDAMTTHAEAIGSLTIRHRTRGEMKFHFRDPEDMRRAIEWLPSALGASVAVNAVLDRQKWKYVRA